MCLELVGEAMERLRKTLILLLVAGIPAAAPPLHPSSSLCFTAGPMTYRFSPVGAPPDFRVQIDERAAHPDLRIQLVDRAEMADFVLVDDDPVSPGSACDAAGAVKSVALVAEGSASDVRIALSRGPDDADFRIFVHSARVTDAQAAALFVAMRQHDSQQVTAVR